MTSPTKIIILIFCFTGLLSQVKAQDTNDTKNRYFYVNIGINNTIPKAEKYNFFYDESKRIIDGQTFNYSVSPQYSFMGGGLSFGFQYPIIKNKKIKIKEYGIFVGTTFFGNYFSSSSPNSYKEERDLNAMGRYFILNYGLSYQC